MQGSQYVVLRTKLIFEAVMSTEIDLDSRPSTYFRPQSLEKHLISTVKGAVLKRKSKTVATFDIGLRLKKGLLNFAVSEEKTCDDLRLILGRFYDDPSWSALGAALPTNL